MLTGEVSPANVSVARLTGETNEAPNEDGMSKVGGESERSRISMALSWLAGLGFGGLLGIVLVTLAYQAPTKLVSSPYPSQENGHPRDTKAVVEEAAKLLLSPLPREDARQKASGLLFSCTQRWFAGVNRHTDVQAFLTRERLSVEGPPAGTATGPAEMLTLHVRLAFVYMLGGLISIVPSTPDNLAVSLDIATLVTRAHVHRALFQRLPIYFKYLASIAGVQADKVLLREVLALQTNVHKALAVAADAAQRNPGKQPIVVDTTADQVVIIGLPAQAFADAVEFSTPYPRSAAVDVYPPVLPVLATVWDSLSAGDNLYVWTSWSVLEELARYVDRTVANTLSQNTFVVGCINRVKHIMAVPLAALILMPPEGHHGAKDNVKALVSDVRSCLARNASRWLRTASVEASDVVVGFPPEEDSVDKLNARYSHYPEVQGSFCPVHSPSRSAGVLHRQMARERQTCLRTFSHSSAPDTL
ncbi:hypothetical protein V5799_027257 [Amblyomma americanum]|uniref:Transmembrane protein n=1 Tax=Amblyomma americanum TaxID=6943 RepID=A0AAQ4DG89_AMBAM